eukprot:6953237-Prymnesium_polylepis.1
MSPIVTRHQRGHRRGSRDDICHTCRLRFINDEYALGLGVPDARWSAVLVLSSLEAPNIHVSVTVRHWPLICGK